MTRLQKSRDMGVVIHIVFFLFLDVVLIKSRRYVLKLKKIT